VTEKNTLETIQIYY